MKLTRPGVLPRGVKFLVRVAWVCFVSPVDVPFGNFTPVVIFATALLIPVNRLVIHPIFLISAVWVYLREFKSLF